MSALSPGNAAQTPSAGALKPAIDALAAARHTVPESTLAERLDTFEQLSTGLLSRDGASVPGAAFLAAFLRRGHMEALLRREVPNLEAVDGFVATGPRAEMRIFPRGTVCHWIAGNVPLLGVFSWAFSATFGNLNLIRVSSRNDDVLSPIVERVRGISEAGREMADRTRVITFPREDDASHATMSRCADLRIAWGGEEAVSAVKALPARWECDDLVFGPRRSFAIMDPLIVDDAMVGRLANDIVYFDQLACSSPQVVFVKSAAGATETARFVSALTAAIDTGARQFRRHPLDWSETYLIELDRQRAILEGGEVFRDDATEWTVAVMDGAVGHITCANRFVQVVPYSSIAEIGRFLPANVQTIVTALSPNEAAAAANELGKRGVCRFPRPGMGNSFEIPWDGVPVAPRMGHWVTRAT